MFKLSHISPSIDFLYPCHQLDICFFCHFSDKCNKMALISIVGIARLGMTRFVDNLSCYQERVILIGQFGHYIVLCYN